MKFITFNDILGHDKFKKFVFEKLADSAYPHAVLICGQKGSGKTSLACALASVLMCSSPKGIIPCGACASCKLMKNSVFPELCYVTNLGKKNISVDAVRQAISFMSIKPAYAPRKVCIIDDADTLNDEAQNAFLKTLEEPPKECIIILTCTHKERLLPTVLSRVAEFDLEPCTLAQTIEFVRAKYPEHIANAEFYHNFSGGALGITDMLCSDEHLSELRNEALRCIGAITSGQTDSAYAAAAWLVENKDDIEFILRVFSVYYSDLLNSAADNLDTVARVRRSLSVLADLRRMLNFNTNFNLACETAMIRLRDV